MKFKPQRGGTPIFGQPEHNPAPLKVPTRSRVTIPPIAKEPPKQFTPTPVSIPKEPPKFSTRSKVRRSRRK